MRKYLHPVLLITVMLTGAKLRAQKMDTVLMVKLKEVEVKDRHQWANDTDRYYFNQTKYYIQIIWPYVEAATRTFNEVNAKLQEKNIGKKQRKYFIQAKEEELRMRFEDRIKALNETQGVLLIKLVARQTGVNIYSILTEFKNPFTAVKWQAWAKLNGFNLNKKYNPDDEPLLEQAMLSLGHDLPGFYNKEEAATAMQHE